MCRVGRIRPPTRRSRAHDRVVSVAEARRVPGAAVRRPARPAGQRGRRRMPQPEGQELADIRARREELRQRYLRSPGQRAATTVAGVHHMALICRDVEETIRFYQEFLGFPLVELVENRDYQGSSHFFFDIGNRNLLGFFDFPGHDHQDYVETISAVQHLALSVSAEHFAAIKTKLDEAGIGYLGPDRGIEDSIYIRDPNGVGIEFYQETLGVFNGELLV